MPRTLPIESMSGAGSELSSASSVRTPASASASASSHDRAHSAHTGVSALAPPGGHERAKCCQRCHDRTFLFGNMLCKRSSVATSATLAMLAADTRVADGGVAGPSHDADVATSQDHGSCKPSRSVSDNVQVRDCGLLFLEFAASQVLRWRVHPGTIHGRLRGSRGRTMPPAPHVNS